MLLVNVNVEWLAALGSYYSDSISRVDWDEVAVKVYMTNTVMVLQRGVMVMHSRLW